MVALAVSLGIAPTNYQIPFTSQGDGSYIINMPNGIIFEDANDFCLHDMTVGDRWTKATFVERGVYADTPTTFTHSTIYGNNNDMLIISKEADGQTKSSFTAYAIELSKPTADTYTITFHTTRVASVSPY